MLTTSLRKLRENNACLNRYSYLNERLTPAEKTGELSLWRIAEINGLRDCLWAFRAVHEEQKPQAKITAIRLAVFCSRECLSNFTANFPKDKRPLKAILAAENYIKKPSKKNARAAWNASWSAASAARRAAESALWSAASAAESAAWSARSAWNATESAWNAAESAWSAAESARNAAESTWSVAESAERAESAAREKYTDYLIELLKES